MAGDGKRTDIEKPANDNRAPDGRNAEALERLDAVVLSIARLIGRRMAREDYEKAMRAANDNAQPKRDEPGEGDT